MQTLHPEALIEIEVLYESHNRNVQPCRYEKHRKVNLILDLFFEDFISYGLIFVLFQIIQKGIQMHF